MGYPDAAAADLKSALDDAREVEHAATSMFALSHVSLAHTFRRDFAAAETLASELVALGNEKGSLYWKSYGRMLQAWLFLHAGRASDAIDIGTAAVAAIRSTGATAYAPWYLSYLASAHAKLGRFDEAWRCITDALSASETTGEKWCDAEIYRIAGDIALMSPEADPARIDAYLDRALSVAREQRASSLELRAATRLARLWHGRGRSLDASNLLAPVLARFTEGFDTPDLVEANALLKSLPRSAQYS